MVLSHCQNEMFGRRHPTPGLPLALIWTYYTSERITTSAVIYQDMVEWKDSASFKPWHPQAPESLSLLTTTRATQVLLYKKPTADPGSLLLQSRQTGWHPQSSFFISKTAASQAWRLLCQSGKSWLEAVRANPEVLHARGTSCPETVNTIPQKLGSSRLEGSPPFMHSFHSVVFRIGSDHLEKVHFQRDVAVTRASSLLAIVNGWRCDQDRSQSNFMAHGRSCVHACMQTHFQRTGLSFSKMHQRKMSMGLFVNLQKNMLKERGFLF